MRLPTLLLPLLLGAALAAPAPASVQPGQTWTLSATTFDGEVLSTALREGGRAGCPNVEFSVIMNRSCWLSNPSTFRTAR